MCVVSGAVAATISAVTTAVSTGIAIAGAVRQGQAAEKQAKYESQVASYEAEVARQAGDVEIIQKGIADRKRFGAQMARLAASNVDLSFGSAQSSLVETKKYQAFDSMILGRSIDNRVLGIEMGGREALARGKNAKTASIWNAVGAGVGGAAALGSQALAFHSVGISPTSTKTELKYTGRPPASSGEIAFRGFGA